MQVRGLGSMLALLLLLSVPALAAPGDSHSYSLSLLGGVGGSPDVEPGSGFGNTGYQLNFSVVRESGTLIGARVGRVDLSDEERFGPLREAFLDYALLGGEYLFNESYYVSGVFLGVGGYRLSGDPVSGGESEEETAFGGSLGLSGEFGLTRSLAIRVELAGHYADLETTQVFGTAHVGLTLHF